MEENRYCPECCWDTLHAAVDLFPDEVDSPLVWMCTVCLEENSLVDE